MEAITYSARDPYPTIQNLQPNPIWARVLSESYSGLCSELTAICQYIYHHQEAAAVDGHISAILRGVAIVEMRHLDLLGGCIRQLGMQPRYRYFRGGTPRFWNASCVHYGRSLRQMIQQDIQDEHTAISHYEASIDVIPEPQIQKLLARIIEDERLHIDILQALL